MAQAESKTKGVWCNEGDDVEQSLEVLDKVLLEFEEPDSLPPIVEPDSPSQGNQSEDDGYMSMNGKRTKFSPGFQPTDEVDTSEPAAAATTNLSDNKSSPSPTDLVNNVNESELISAEPVTKRTEEQENIRHLQEEKFQHDNPNDSAPLQTTLPKARTAAISKYASLPCPNQNVVGIKKQNSEGSQFCFQNRNPPACTVLGIGISAVHDAVLRGIAPLPEPIVNEHPVTIYPGRSSPSPPSGVVPLLLRRPVPPRTLTDSIERHREVCRKNPSLPHSPPQTLIDTLDFVLPPNIALAAKQASPVTSHMERHHGHHPKTSDSEDNFSDDSLEEGVSLPPAPPPAPFAPPPPSLSCPATPTANKTAQKRVSVAWEIHLGDDGKHHSKSPIHSNVITTAKVFSKRRVRSVSDSHSSLASTPSNSYAPNDGITVGCEWPEPPVCSTEDEAASLYSDLDDVPYNPPPPPLNSSGGTYVIRKGRKERQRLSEINAFHITNDDVNGARSNQLRHSIDLGVADSTSSQAHNKQLIGPNTPRTRLSLDLNSPSSDLLLMLPATTVAVAHQHSHRHHYQPSNHPSSSLPIHNKSNKSKYKAFGSGSFELESEELRSSSEEHESDEKHHDDNMSPLVRVSSMPTITPPLNGTNCEVISTPRRDLAPPPPIEEDEEPESDSNRDGPPPLRQIESNISALLRGDIAVARVGELQSARRPLGFRPGVHKSESAKEMLLSQQSQFGPLPPSPPATPSSPEPESDGFPPLPPSPIEDDSPPFECARNHSNMRIMPSRTRLKADAPAVPPHGRHTMAPPSTTASLKTRSMDAGYGKRNISSGGHGGHGPPHTDSTSRRRLMSGAFPKRASQSPGEERRLQTSCSLPETPIFARGCDVPRTPHRRAPELPGCGVGGGSRTAPRTNSSLNSSVIGIGAPIVATRQRSISQALAGTEMLRMAGGPARGWYPKQRHPRPASTEHLDHLHGSHGHGSITRAWDLSTAGPGGPTGTGGRKTLPPNFTPPKFFGAKSPREALRRVTSLLIKKGNTNGKEKEKEPKPEKTKLDTISSGGGSPRQSNASTDELSATAQKKKGFFKSFWKKSKHYSLEH